MNSSKEHISYIYTSIYVTYIRTYTYKFFPCGPVGEEQHSAFSCAKCTAVADYFQPLLGNSLA